MPNQRIEPRDFRTTANYLEISLLVQTIEKNTIHKYETLFRKQGYFILRQA